MNFLKDLTKEFIEILEKHNLILDIVKGEILEKRIKEIELTVEEKNDIKTFIVKSNGLKNEEEYNQFISQSKLTEENLINKIGKNLKLEVG